MQELAARIANAARNVLESTPPELAADVSGTGILLTGGGSLRGLAGYIAGELHTDVAIAPDPLNCVARGTAISLSEGKYLSAGFRDATPKVWNRRLNHSHDPFTGSEEPLTAWPTREAYADGSAREPYAAHVGAGHARPCTSPQTPDTGKPAGRTCPAPTAHF
ncbi:rod shape-determining protein [Gemmiger formicilis]|nr:rod shape-determining protein [Gemmiger formicilis]